MKKKFYKIIRINPNNVKYIGDVNQLIIDTLEESKFGIITAINFSDDKLKKLIFYFNNNHVNPVDWVYLSVDNSLRLFLFNIALFNKEIDKSEFLSNINDILGSDYTDLYTYPIYNVLLTLEPAYPKDIIELRRRKRNGKFIWNTGKLGKKEVRRKYEKMRRKILYKNL